MPRRREVAKREILPDPKHHSELLTKFINVLMVSGKKSIAEKIVYGALDELAEKLKKIKKNEVETSGAAFAGSRVVTHSAKWWALIERRCCHDSCMLALD